MTPTNEAGHGLPELPEPEIRGVHVDGFSADQMVSMWKHGRDAALREVKPEKTAPVQGYTPGIPWSMHLEAYDVYCKRYRPQPALIEGWCRGGFSTGELDMFIPGWRERLSEFNAMKARIAELEAMQATPAAAGAQGEDQQVQAQAQQRGADSDLPFTTTQRVVRALLHLGHGVPESQEEQSARSNELVLTLCSEVMASTTPQPAAADGGVREASAALSEPCPVAGTFACRCGKFTIPMDKGPWRASDDGKDVFSDDFSADVALRISGDFIDDHHRKDYAAWLARTLNGKAALSSHRQAGALPVAQIRCSGKAGPHDVLYAGLIAKGPLTQEVKEGDLLYLAPPPGADLSKFRELAERWRDYGKDCGVSQVWGKCADELLNLIDGSPK